MSIVKESRGNRKFSFYYEKRLHASPMLSISVSIASVIMALLFSGIFLYLSGYNPINIYIIMFGGAFGSYYGITETIVKAIPLIFASLGVGIAFKIYMYNIGAEGQLYMGGFAATIIPFFFPNLPIYIMLPLMIIMAMIAGGIWALIPAVLKVYWRVNEIITTLMLNYVAILWVDYLVYGPWKDPEGYNFPLTPMFSKAAILPSLGSTRLHIGIILAIIATIIMYIVLQKTKWGYEIRVIGESPKVARYAGMDIARNILIVMFISGCLAGIAGMTEVSGINHRLQHAFSPGYGYTAIIIAWLSKLNPFAIIIVSILLGGLIVGGYTIQSTGLTSATVYMIQGAILFFVLGGEFFTRYRLKIIK